MSSLPPSLGCLSPNTSSNISRVFMVGDVMLGRGVDQTLRYKVDPILYEGYVTDARDYVKLAVRKNGPLPENRSVDYIWGDSLQILDEVQPDVRIINLETSVTDGGTPWPNKGIHYRMHPKNVEVIQSASIDCCILANNHVLDWNYQGLADTLESLKKANVKTVGAGRNFLEASTPAIFEIPGKSGRILVFGIGASSSGVPQSWLATENRPGVYHMDPSSNKVNVVKSWIARYKQPKDVAIFSIHWGSNWDWDLEPGDRQFAHKLIDQAGVDLIYGHSSHHIKGVEVYKGKLIIYGCGDFLSDYEGIDNYHGSFRDEVSFMYFADLDHENQGRLVNLYMVPMRLKHVRVKRATGEDSEWLFRNMKRECLKFGSDVEKRDGYFQLLVKKSKS